MDQYLELRLYRLHADARDRFHRVFAEDAVPMLRRYGITVVGHGPSSLDDTGYYLLRAFASMGQRGSALERFYGSEEWLTCYRDEVMGMIESYLTVVLAPGEVARMLESLIRAGRIG